MKPTSIALAALAVIAAPFLAPTTLTAQEAAAATTGADATSAPEAFDTMAVGRRATRLFLDGDADSLWAMLTPEFQEKVGSADGIMDRLDMINDRAGTEVLVIEESIRMRHGRPQYWRVTEFDLAPEPLLLRWVISPEGKISGQGLGLASQAPPTDDEAQAKPKP